MTTGYAKCDPVLCHDLLLHTPVSEKVLHRRSGIPSLYRPQQILGRHGGDSFRVEIGIDDESSVSHVLLQHVAEGSVLDRPDPLLGRKGNDLVVECRDVYHEPPVPNPFGEEGGEVPIPDCPVPFDRENRCHTPAIESAGGQGIEGREDRGVDGNVRDGGNPVENGRNHVDTQGNVEEIDGRPDRNDLSSLCFDLLPEVRHHFRHDVDVLADRAVGGGCGSADAIHLDVQYVVQIGLGFLEAAGLGIGARAGTAHQEAVLLVVVHPNGSDIQAAGTRCVLVVVSCELRRLSRGKSRGGNEKERREDDDALEFEQYHGGDLLGEEM
mmetsp:Transcript_23528/g.50062  ORF Transcript_23528/g.50062 Transcript_23528/m.50062 type:complete len:325 (+) Transcript_23528:126-1100(+)